MTYKVFGGTLNLAQSIKNKNSAKLQIFRILKSDF